MGLPEGIGYLGSPKRAGASHKKEESGDVSALHHR
jgi:hypothetical protein